MESAPKLKIPAIRIPLDECLAPVVDAAGAKTMTVVHPGEWIDVLPVLSVGQARRLVGLIGTNDDKAFAQELSAIIVAWEMSDVLGVAFRPPWQDPTAIMDMFDRLSTEEQAWIVRRLLNRESPAERKNA